MIPLSIVARYLSNLSLNEEEKYYVNYHMRRYVFILNLIEEYTARINSLIDRPVRLLDIGPQFLTGLICNQFKDAHVNTLGFCYPRAYDTARIGRHWHYDLINCMDKDKWPDYEEHDLIIMAEVLEHLYVAPETVFECIKGFLSKTGYLIMQTPNAVALEKRIAMLSGRNPFEMIRQSIGNPGHFREYTAEELRTVGAKAGLYVDTMYLSNFYSRDHAMPRLCAFASRRIKNFRQNITIVYTRNPLNLPNNTAISGTVVTRS